MPESRHDVRIGCSGWNYPHWRDAIYPSGVPERLWLELYSTMFDTVEVNSTYYRLPTQKAVRGWAEQTPDDFCFAIKASRYLTHVRRLRDLRPGIERLCERIVPLAEAGKLGATLWQLPGQFHRDDDRLAAALAVLPAGRHAFEFRHESWFDPGVMALLSDYGVALVIGDTPERPFQTVERTAPFTYLRLHYGHRGRGGNYSVRELQSWRRRIVRWRRDVDVYAYLNNDWNAYAPRNARWLVRQLAEEPAPASC